MTEVRSDLSDAAFRLLMLIRGEHAARMARGETFLISPEAMAHDQCIPGWGHCRYRSARDELEAAGLIEFAGLSREGS